MVTYITFIVFEEKNQLQAAKLPLDVICNKHHRSGSHSGYLEVNNVLSYIVLLPAAVRNESQWKIALMQLPFCKLWEPGGPQIQRSGDLT